MPHTGPLLPATPPEGLWQLTDGPECVSLLAQVRFDQLTLHHAARIGFHLRLLLGLGTSRFKYCGGT
jgi:hypothetical protein